MSSVKFIALFSLFNLVCYHLPLWQYVQSISNNDRYYGLQYIVVLILIILVVTALVLLFLSLVNTSLIKPFCIILVIANSVALYFLFTYQALFDRTMMGNVLNTRTSEAVEFLHYKLIGFLFAFGFFPTCMIYRTKVDKSSNLSVLGWMCIIVLSLVLVIYVSSGTWLWFDRYSKQLGGRILPWSYIINTVRHAAHEKSQNVVAVELPVGQIKNQQKMLVMLVIGETARAANFSLFGYDRETNPKLKDLSIATLANTTACSTYTTASIRCMLSHSSTNTKQYEPLPNYLKRHNVDVIWRTANWGQPNIEVDSFQNAGALQQNCDSDECGFDGVLLTGLRQQIQSSDKQKIFVTLHTKGSHGPAYHLRYPKSFEQFVPVCNSVEFGDCNDESLVNAYDNTILYTDHFLAQSIDLLAQLSDIPTVMIYISDHGESLGENGLYLHGAPYSIAPNVQKEIPFIVWMSDNFRAHFNINSDDLDNQKAYGHRHIFHSVLGAFQLDSPVYRSELDIFRKLSSPRFGIFFTPVVSQDTACC